MLLLLAGVPPLLTVNSTQSSTSVGRILPASQPCCSQARPSPQQRRNQPASPASRPCCSWSVEASSGAVTQTTATVKINPPPEGGPYDSFVLYVCRKPLTGTPNWDTCPTTTCLPSQVNGCVVSGLDARTNYTMTAIAVNGETSSIRSSPADFTTLAWP